MAQSLLIRGAGQLLTLRGPAGLRRGAALRDLGIIEDAGVLIRDGIIVQVGSTRRLENLKECRDAAEISADGAVLMPGFVDSAIHLSPIGPSPESKRLTNSAFGDASAVLLRSCAVHGTLQAQVSVTVRNQKERSGFGVLRQIANLANRPVGLVRTWRVDDRGSQSALMTDLNETLAVLIERKLAHRIEVSPESHSQVRERVWEAAHVHSLPINFVCDDTCKDLLDTLAKIKPRMIRCPHPVSPELCNELAQSGLPIVRSTCKALTESVSSDYAGRLLAQNAGIAIASGYDESELPVFNMQTAITSAVFRYGLTAEQAIAAATVNAACAAGLGRVTGTLEAGKRADLRLLDLTDYRELPRRFGTNHVALAIREGRVIYNRTNRKVNMR